MIAENLKSGNKYKVLYDIVTNATNGSNEFGVVYESLESGLLYYRKKQEFDSKFKILNEVAVDGAKKSCHDTSCSTVRRGIQSDKICRGCTSWY